MQYDTFLQKWSFVVWIWLTTIVMTPTGYWRQSCKHITRTILLWFHLSVSTERKLYTDNSLQ